MNLKILGDNMAKIQSVEPNIANLVNGWLKAYGLVIWYVLIETVTAAALAVAYVLKTGQTDTSRIEVFIADTVFITTIIAGFIVMTPFIPKLMKKKKESQFCDYSLHKKRKYFISLFI